MREVEFTETERVVVEQIKSGVGFEAICQTTTLSPHCAKSVLRSIVRKSGILHPEILAIKQFYD